MFQDILFILTEKAAKVHGELITSNIKRFTPNSRLRIICDPMEMKDTNLVDVLVTPQIPWLSDAVNMCPNLRWLHLLTAGAERIFESGLDKGPYWISKSAGVNAPAIAEYVIGVLLFFAKQFHVFTRQQRDHQWNRTWLNELSGKKVAILGLGQVGRTVAERCAAMGLQTSGISRRALPVKGVNEVFSLQDVQYAVKGAHFVIVSLPLTFYTKRLVNHDFFLFVEKGACLVDVSRSGIVVEAAIVDALKSGHLSGAALDVFENEPLTPKSDLWDLPNVLITPHVAGTSDLFMNRAMEIFENNFLSLKNNGFLSTPVDRVVGY